MFRFDWNQPQNLFKNGSGIRLRGLSGKGRRGNRRRQGTRRGEGSGQSQPQAASGVLFSDDPEQDSQQQVNGFELPGFL